MKHSKRLLFVTHDASRTGAPLVLLNFLKWINANCSEIKSDIVLKKGGVLEKEFYLYGEVYNWKITNRFINFLDNHHLWGKNKDKIVNLINIGHSTVHSAIKRQNYDLVYVNTLANCDIVPRLAEMVSCPIICHVHELKSVVELHCGSEVVSKALGHFDKFIAVSDLVFEYLTNDLKVSSDKISRIPEFIRLPDTVLDKSQCRKDLDIDDNSFVVCASGTIDWRKGADLFVQIAANLMKANKNLDVIFFWIGGNLKSRFFKELMLDIAKLGLKSRLHFTGSIENPWLYYAASDLFALTSREDPFPLVALEAASLGLPVVCFDNAVGSTEFVNSSTGAVVPYLDTKAFSDAVLGYMEDPVRLRVASREIKKLSENYSMDIVCEKLLKFIQNV